MVTKPTVSQAEDFSWVTGKRETRPLSIGLSQNILAFSGFLSLSLCVWWNRGKTNLLEQKYPVEHTLTETLLISLMCRRTFDLFYFSCIMWQWFLFLFIKCVKCKVMSWTAWLFNCEHMTRYRITGYSTVQRVYISHELIFYSPPLVFVISPPGTIHWCTTQEVVCCMCDSCSAHISTQLAGSIRISAHHFQRSDMPK